MKIRAQDVCDTLVPAIEIEDEPLERAQLIESLLLDADGQEDYYLGEIARAEAGETIDNCYNHYIYLHLYPDLAVLEDLWDPPAIDGQETEGPGRCIRLTLDQTRQLLRDWLAAKRQWREQHPRPPANETAHVRPTSAS